MGSRVCRRTVQALTLAMLCACCRPHSETSGKPDEILFSSDDGVRIAATLYPANETSPPGLLLVHMLGSDHTAWRAFAVKAQRQGFMCLAFDIRGHGKSTTQDGKTISYRRFTTEDWQAALNDIDAAKRALLEHGADPANLALVGASIGANLALNYAAQSRDFHALVLVSPGLDYKGVRTGDAITAYGKRPVLLIATEGDSYSASSCTTLKNAAAGLCELREYPGTAHGTDIFDVSRNATEHVFLWLSQVLAQ